MGPTESPLVHSAAPCWGLRVFGGLLICLGLAYEPQQARIQDYLESLWVKIDDLQKAGLRRRTAFVIFRLFPTYLQDIEAFADYCRANGL